MTIIFTVILWTVMNTVITLAKNTAVVAVPQVAHSWPDTTENQRPGICIGTLQRGAPIFSHF